MRRTLSLVLLAMTLIAPLAVPAQAQDDNPNPAIVICLQGSGCFHSDKSGEVTTEQMTSLLGDNETGGDTVVCTTSEGCQWSAVGPEDLDLTFGGDGELDGEKKPAPEAPADSDSLFVEIEIGDDPLVPVAGTWITYHSVGVMDCSVIAIDIPANPPEPGTLIVEDDGAVLTLDSSDPETSIVPMIRVQNGVYHGIFEVSTEEGVMTINYNEVFVAPTMAFGMLSGEMTSQGMECVLSRPFFTILEGLDLLDAPLPDDLEATGEEE